MIGNPLYKGKIQKKTDPIQQRADARKELQKRIALLEKKAEGFDKQAARNYDLADLALLNARTENRDGNGVTSRHYFEQSMLYKNKYNEYVKLAICTRNYASQVEMAIDAKDLDEDVAAISTSVSQITSADTDRGLVHLLENFDKNYQDMMKTVDLTSHVINSNAGASNPDMDEQFAKFKSEELQAPKIALKTNLKMEEDDDETSKNLQERLLRLKQTS